jgi:hypothetical protein
MEQKPITVAYPFVGDIEVGGGHVTILVRIRNLDHRRFRPLIVVHGASNGTDRASCRRRLLEELDQPPDTRIIGFFASLRSHAPT